MVLFQKDTKIYGQVGREKMGMNTITMIVERRVYHGVLKYKLYRTRLFRKQIRGGTHCISRLRHGPEKAPRLRESAHSNHGSEDVVCTLLGVTAWTIGREEESCGKHQITAYKKSNCISCPRPGLDDAVNGKKTNLKTRILPRW